MVLLTKLVGEISLCDVLYRTVSPDNLTMPPIEPLVYCYFAHGWNYLVKSVLDSTAHASIFSPQDK